MQINKVDIDNLIDVLLKFRQDHQYVDIKIEKGNIMRVRAHNTDKKSEDKLSDDNEDLNNLNQLIG